MLEDHALARQLVDVRCVHQIAVPVRSELRPEIVDLADTTQSGGHTSKRIHQMELVW